MRNVIPDAGSVEIPYLSYEDSRRFNCLTAYNASRLEKQSKRCGCFHCGSRFLAGEITGWMSERDGEDTALCPYCGCDAVITATDGFPLTTALLSKLYLRWFDSEHANHRANATDVPSYLGEDDYLRKGIPFLTDSNSREMVVDEVELSEVRKPGHMTGIFRCYENSYRSELLIGGKVGGTIKMALTCQSQRVRSSDGLIDINGYLELTTDQGKLLLREPYRDDTNGYLVKIIKQYGTSLKGIIVAPRDKFMRLIVNRPHAS